MAVKVKIHGLGIKDMLKFKKMPEAREKKIAAAKPEEVSAVFKINENARRLHPDYQNMIIDEIIEHTGANAKTFILKRADGYKAASFRAGQYISVLLKIGDTVTTRPYSISSAPALTKSGRYAITVRATNAGFASEYILNNWNIGDRVTVSDPQGNFFYDDIRDPQNIIAIAGGSGITPFLSMAAAIRDKTEKFNLTILYGSKTKDSILFEEELNKITSETDKVKVIHVLSDEEAEGFEHGFITSELILKYAPIDNYSVFICGPEAMYKFIEKETAALSLPSKNIRREMLGVTKNISSVKGFPSDISDKTFTLTVRLGGEEYTVPAAANEPILVAIERAGIPAPSRCRSGECGWCRSKLVDGKIFCPAENEYRRWADKQAGYIHPCCTFAISNCTIEISGTYIK